MLLETGAYERRMKNLI